MAKKTDILTDTNDNAVIRQQEDLTPYLEANKAEFNQASSTWSDDPLGNKIASIPNIVIDQLNKDGIMRGFAVIDQRRFFNWLNDPDNRFFRTKPGKL
jgi:hypothetical protein